MKEDPNIFEDVSANNHNLCRELTQIHTVPCWLQTSSAILAIKSGHVLHFEIIVISYENSDRGLGMWGRCTCPGSLLEEPRLVIRSGF